MIEINNFNEKMACQIVADETGIQYTSIFNHAIVKESYYDMFRWLYLEELKTIEDYNTLVEELINDTLEDKLGFSTLAEYTIKTHGHITVTDFGIVYIDTITLKNN